LRKWYQLQRYIDSFGQIIRELDNAIAQMRIYAGQRTSRQKVEYKRFFDEKKETELEGYVNDVNKELTGADVPNWDNIIRKM
jgi:hypothetical protein